MRFASPVWLYGLLLIPVGYLMIRFLINLKKSRFEAFANAAVWQRIAPELDWARPKRKEKIFWFAMIFVLFAAARPQWGKIEETYKTTGLDMMLIVDISRSMEVEDVVPTRLKKAKHMIRGLIERLTGDRVGLVAFAGSSYLSVPLTTDLGYLDEQVGILSPDLIQNQGSDLGIALETARGALERAAEESGSKEANPSRVAVLISDGEDHEEGALSIAKKMAETGIKVYVFSVGTTTGGPIPIRDEAGQLRGYKRTQKGEVVVSKANPDYMSRLASAAGGRFWESTPTEPEIEEMLADLGALNRSEFLERKIVTYREQFQWPLSVAVILILLEWAVALRRPDRSPLTHLIQKEQN